MSSSNRRSAFTAAKFAAPRWASIWSYPRSAAGTTELFDAMLVPTKTMPATSAESATAPRRACNRPLVVDVAACFARLPGFPAYAIPSASVSSSAASTGVVEAMTTRYGWVPCPHIERPPDFAGLGPFISARVGGGHPLGRDGYPPVHGTDHPRHRA